MTTKMDRNRVLDARTWLVLDNGDRAEQALVKSCAADGCCYARQNDEGVWIYANALDMRARIVRIAIPSLTATSGIPELATLLHNRDVRLTRLMTSRGGGMVYATVASASTGETAQGEDPEAWRAINLALWRLENHQ